MISFTGHPVWQFSFLFGKNATASFSVKGRVNRFIVKRVMDGTKNIEK